jgi:hypothetical protein
MIQWTLDIAFMSRAYRNWNDIIYTHNRIHLLGSTAPNGRNVKSGRWIRRRSLYYNCRRPSSPNRLPFNGCLCFLRQRKASGFLE